MPTYQYACTSSTCGERFERVQAFTDPAVTECPVCGQPVRKVYGSVGVVFKGSGFYRTDSRADGGAKSGATNGKGGDSGKAGSSKDSGTSSSSPSSSSSSGSGSKNSSSGASSSTSAAAAAPASA